MKKYVLSFIVFVLVFLGALGFLYTKANPTEIRLSGELGQLNWHGQIENEYGTYDGALIGDLFQGEGDFRFLSGQTYTGDWQESYMSGSGVLLFPGVGEYSGKMSGSQRNGHGRFSWNTGENYEGEWVNDEMSGDGVYTFSNGSVFEGTFQHNRPISGTLTYTAQENETDPDTFITLLKYTFSEQEKKIAFSTKGGLEYDGDLMGLFGTGSADITYPSGNTYSGQLKEGQRDGKGKYEWKNEAGAVLAWYSGNWVSDHMNGSGKYHFSVLEYPYLSGDFENDVPSGTLTYYKERDNTFETVWEYGYCVSVKET